MSAAELELWRDALESRRHALAEAGCAYVFVVAPNKETIYRERVPRAYDSIGPTRLDQLARDLELRSQVDFLDLRAALLAEKARDSGGDTLYPPHGTHWMGRGAFSGYRAIVEHLAPRLGALESYAAADGRFVAPLTHLDSWATHMYVGDILLQRVPYFEPRAGPRHSTVEVREQGASTRFRDAIGGSGAPRAIVFHDSFIDAVRALLSDSFSEVLYVKGEPLSAQEIADFRPDVVIDLFVERRLVGGPPPRLSTLPPARDAAAAFDAAPRIVFALDPARAASDLVAIGGARIDAAGAAAQVTLRAKEKGDEIRLRPIEVPDDSRTYLRVRGSNEAREPLDVYWKPRGEARFKIAMRASFPLGPADSTRTLELDLPAGGIDVLLRPRGDRAATNLRVFELRAAPR